MFSKNSFGSLIVQDQSLGSMRQLGGSGKLMIAGIAMNHEGGIPGSLPILSPQVGDDASGRDLSSVIQRQFNGYSAEEIVEEHSVSNITPSRLEEKMNVLDLATHRNG